LLFLLGCPFQPGLRLLLAEGSKNLHLIVSQLLAGQTFSTIVITWSEAPVASNCNLEKDEGCSGKRASYLSIDRPALLWTPGY